VARVVPLNTTTDEDTKLPPFAVSVKLGGNCENVRVGGEIELRTGTGRALPQSGFTALQAGRNKRASTNPLRRMARGTPPDVEIKLGNREGWRHSTVAQSFAGGALLVTC